MGNSIGANNISLAKRLIKVNSTVASIVVLIIVTIVISLRYQITSLYTSDEEVINLTASALLIQ